MTVCSVKRLLKPRRARRKLPRALRVLGGERGYYWDNLLGTAGAISRLFDEPQFRCFAVLIAGWPSPEHIVKVFPATSFWPWRSLLLAQSSSTET